MKYSNVFSVKTYEENGELKKKYYLVGNIKETEHMTYLNLHQNANTDYVIFESDERETEKFNQ